jgi:predicted dehydrogenase
MPVMKSIALVFSLSAAIGLGADLRLGIIGTDTSHVIAFAKVLNDPTNKNHIPGAKIVAAYKGGSKDVESSYTRVDKYAEELSKTWQVEIVNDIPTLCSKVDAILLESVDGRTHLAQARQVIAAGKPLFIDKPLASTLEDAREIARLAKAANVKWFSTSSLRYSNAVTDMKTEGARAVTTWGPGPYEEHHYLDFSWYGIHPVEMLFAIMGRGCEEVTRTSGANADTTTCRWKDGRIGTVNTLRPYGDYGAIVLKDKASQQSQKVTTDYVPMLREIIKFFQTGVVPVANEDTLEIFAFMDAAQRSKEAGGKPVRLR